MAEAGNWRIRIELSHARWRVIHGDMFKRESVRFDPGGF
jgi:hypothetical protein